MTTAGDSDDLAPTEGLPTRAAALPPAVEGEAGTLAPGTRMGRYRIEALLGRGGMGEVYRAGQLEPVRRTVALKLMNARRLDARHLAYFEVERQMLAHMKHPAIAQVYDAGATAEGFPFFAMEFIEGSPLTTWCEQHRLPLRDRLELFVRVCEGVQHAHQKGVIHRDLKPGNILVTEIDGRPVPKIIDFGIATAASRSLAAGEHAGEFERAGTPDYMSPEQAGLEPGVEVDTRSDVYSLGVLLYELLAGRRPGLGADTARAANTATGTTVPPPSAQIETLSPGSAGARAEQLGLSRPKLRRLLRHELDWVVLKAMRRDRAGRYDSAAALADELHRFLDDRPLQAVPSSRRYIAGKWLRRHRIGFAAASAVSLAVLSGFALSLYGLQQANTARAVAEEQRALAERRSAELERVAAFQQSMLEGADIEAMGAGLTAGLRAQLEANAPERVPAFEGMLASISPPELARQLVDRHLLAGARAAIDRDFEDQPALAADLRLAVGKVQLALGLFTEAAATFEQVAVFHESQGGELSRPALMARERQASALANDERPGEARPLFERLLAATADAPPGDDLRLRVERQLASAIFDLGDRAAAREQLEALLAREGALRDPADPELLSVQEALAMSMIRMGQLSEGRALFETMYERSLAAHGPEHPSTESTMGRLAIARAIDGEPELAVPLQRELLALAERRHGAEHPRTLTERANLANMLLDLREYGESEALMRKVLEGRVELAGRDSRTTIRAQLNLGSLLARTGRYEEAMAIEREVIEARTRLFGPEHPDTVMIVTNHALTSHRAGVRPERVQAQLDTARPLVHRVLGDRHPQTHAIDFIQCLTWIHLGRYPEAIAGLRELIAIGREKAEPDEPPNAQQGWALAMALELSGDRAAAEAVRASDVQWLFDLPESERGPGETNWLEIIAEEERLLRRFNAASASLR